MKTLRTSFLSPTAFLIKHWRASFLHRPELKTIKWKEYLSSWRQVLNIEVTSTGRRYFGGCEVKDLQRPQNQNHGFSNTATQVCFACTLSAVKRRRWTMIYSLISLWKQWKAQKASMTSVTRGTVWWLLLNWAKWQRANLVSGMQAIDGCYKDL